MNTFKKLSHAYALVLNDTDIKLQKQPHDLSQQEKEHLLWWEGFCDGSFQPSKGMMGIGGVLLNPFGNVSEIFSEAKVMPGSESSGSSKAEFEAVLRLLQMAQNKGIKKILIKMDNRGAAQALSSGSVGRVEAIKGYLEKARNISKSFDQVVFQWIPRVKNRYADSLSRAQIPEIPSESAKKVAKKPPPSPKVSKESSMDLLYAQNISEKHPGVLVIDKEYFLADSRGAKSKAMAKWNSLPIFRFHTEHGNIGRGVASGVETCSEFGIKAWLLCEERSSPAMAELRLMIKMLNKAKKAGLSKIVIESTNQALCLTIAGLKVPPAHLRSAVLTFFSKAQNFESIAVHHKSNVPAWGELLESAPGKLKKGFHSFQNGFGFKATGVLEVIYDKQNNLVITKTELLEQQLYNAKLAKSKSEAQTLITRSISRQIDYFKNRAVNEINLNINDEEIFSAIIDNTQNPEHLRSDWGHLLRQSQGVLLNTKLLDNKKTEELILVAKQQIPKPFENAPQKMQEWASSKNKKAINF